MPKAMRQMPERSGRVGVARGEAEREPIRDEACDPPRKHPGTGSASPKAAAGALLEVALTRESLQAAWKRVKAKKGAAGVDGLYVEQTAAALRTSRPRRSWPGGQTSKVWCELDAWLRHCLRTIQLRHWKRPRTRDRELKALGVTETVARPVAENSHRWWRNRDDLLKTVLTSAYIDRLGVPRRL